MTRDEMNLSNFAAAQPAVYAWLEANKTSNDFAKSLLAGVARWGDLTEKQMAAVRRNLDRASNPISVKAGEIRHSREEENVARFAAAHPEVLEWLDANEATNSFAKSLREGVDKWGSLTDRQMAAARKGMTNDAKKSAAPARDVDVSKLTAAFDSARDNAARAGDNFKWLTLRLDTFKFTDMPASGTWEASIAVKEGDAKLGRIVRGKFQRTVACDDATADRVVVAAHDPHAAAIAYGQKYKSCSCCGRELTNAVSRRLGIGPICRERYGWGAVPAEAEGVDE